MPTHELSNVRSVALGLGLVGLLCCVGAGTLGMLLSTEMFHNAGSFLGISWLWLGLATATYACWHCFRLGQLLRDFVGGHRGGADAATLMALEKMLWGVSAAMVFSSISMAAVAAMAAWG